MDLNSSNRKGTGRKIGARALQTLQAFAERDFGARFRARRARPLNW
jgi:hypothetical protein